MQCDGVEVQGMNGPERNSANASEALRTLHSSSSEGGPASRSSVAFCLAGATATGKSAVVQSLAEKHGAAILSADAMLVYKGMDIGTAKPTSSERARVPYFGLDCVTPAEDFSTAAWLAVVPEVRNGRIGRCAAPASSAQSFEAQAYVDGAPRKTVAASPVQSLEVQEPINGVAGKTFAVGEAKPRIASPSMPLFVTGGTGLYFSTLLRGLDPAPPADPMQRKRLEALPLQELQARLTRRGAELADMSNPRRLVRALEILESGGELPRSWATRVRPPLLALTWERADLHARIARRVEQMYRDGLLEETEALRAVWPVWSRTAAQAIGYAEALAVLDGALSRPAAIERTVIRTRQLARRQETYLRGQFEMTWIRVTSADTLASLAARVEAAWGL